MPAESNPVLDFSGFRGYLWLRAKVAIGRRWDRRFDASDIVQETLLTAFEKRDQFLGNTRAQARAWVRAIHDDKLRKAIRFNECEQRDIHREVSIDEALDRSTARIWHALGIDSSTPVRKLLREERVERIATLIMELPTAQRHAFVDRHVLDLPIDEVATRLSRSTEAASSLVKRGVTQLRQSLKDAQRLQGLG